MSKLPAPLGIKLADPDLERVRRNHEERIVELQRLPAAGLQVIRDVSLVDSIATVIAHGLGRAPVLVLPSPARGGTTTGGISEVRDSKQYDRSKVVVLMAKGYTTAVVIDLAVL